MVEWLIEKDVEGNGHDLILLSEQCLPSLGNKWFTYQFNILKLKTDLEKALNE
jgi:hypothetical protein